MAGKAKQGKESPMRKAVAAALELATEKPWDHVSIHAIARAADIGMDDLYDMGGKPAVLAEIDRSFDRAMGVDLEPLPEDAEFPQRRERLVEVMMQRFDAMEKHRDAVTHIHDFITSNPAEAAKAAARRLKTARWALEASEIEDGTSVRAMALAASFMRAKGVWLADEAPLDRTLAAIDKDLRSYSEWMDDISDVADKVKDFFSGLGDTFSGSGKPSSDPKDDEPEVYSADEKPDDDKPGKPTGAPPPPL